MSEFCEKLEEKLKEDYDFRERKLPLYGAYETAHYYSALEDRQLYLSVLVPKKS